MSIKNLLQPLVLLTERGMALKLESEAPLRNLLKRLRVEMTCERLCKAHILAALGERPPSGP